MITYADVAATLPLDVREAIEVSAPCAGGALHFWDIEIDWVTNAFGSVVREDRWWRCVYCHVTTHTDPTPAAVCRERGHHTWDPEPMLLTDYDLGLQRLYLCCTQCGADEPVRL